MGIKLYRIEEAPKPNGDIKKYHATLLKTLMNFCGMLYRISHEKGKAAVEYREYDERGVKMKKEEDFLFDEEPMIRHFGKEFVEQLKKEEPKIYEDLRNSTLFMESDVIYTDKRQNERDD